MPHVVEKHSINFQEFCNLHESQLQSLNVPESYWNTLHSKLHDQVYDAGEVFQLMRVQWDSPNDEEAEYLWKVVVVGDGGVEVGDPKHIYLIDHAWTYRPFEARGQLEAVPGLLDRMSALMDIPADNRGSAEAVLRAMWRFNQTYTLKEQEEDMVTYWYIMDEFGSRIQHSDTPTFRTAPLLYAPMAISFTLLWPVQNLNTGDEVTRDCVETVRDSSKRVARLLPWIPDDLSSMSYAQHEPSDEYFDAYRGDETIPDRGEHGETAIRDRGIRVYVEEATFCKHLTDVRFELVNDPSQADALWYTTHWKDFSRLCQGDSTTLVNQFPGEYVLTMKDLLAVVARRCADDRNTTPLWLPVTYNLTTQLLQFVSFFQNNEKTGESNIWIIKPFNRSRGLNIHVSDNLSEILRLPDTGPQVACKYIDRPVLFDRSDVGGPVKFDLRYIVLLLSVRPLKVAIYNMFWLRFANKEFSLDRFDDYEKHFTVMNYTLNAPLKQMLYTDFIVEFERQYPDHSWTAIQNNMFEVFRQLFQAATSQPYPRGIHDNPGSRAMYGIDAMLQWSTDESGGRYIQPMLCEVNFCPDCVRACDYEPEFANDVFAAMFAGDVNERFTVIT